MFTFLIENAECKTLHRAGLDVVVATDHKTPHYISTTGLSKSGLQRIEMNVNGMELNDESTRFGLGVIGWEKRNNDNKKKLGETKDSWALCSGSFIHNNQSFGGPGFPTFHKNHFHLTIVVDYESSQGEFWLDGQMVNTIRKLPKKQFQIFIYLKNGSISMKYYYMCKNWAPQVFRFRDGSMKEIMLRREKLMNEIYLSVKRKIITNILLIGEPNVGKTSFINTIMTACSKDRHLLHDVIPYGSVRDQNYKFKDDEKIEIHSHTRKITSYRLPHSHIYLWDSFGMCSKGTARYLNNFSSIMEGKLRPGYDKSIDALDQPEYVYSKNLLPQHRIHCVVVFIDGVKLMENDDSIFDSAREFIDTAQHIHDDGLRTIIVLTKVDIIGKNQFINGIRQEKFDIKNVYQNPIIYEKAKLIRLKLGVGLNQIIPVANYSSSEETQGLNYFIELLHLRVVALAFKYSQTIQDHLTGTTNPDTDTDDTSDSDSDDSDDSEDEGVKKTRKH